MSVKKISAVIVVAAAVAAGNLLAAAGAANADPIAEADSGANTGIDGSVQGGGTFTFSYDLTISTDVPAVNLSDNGDQPTIKTSAAITAS